MAICSATQKDSKPRFSASRAISPGFPDFSVRNTDTPIFIHDALLRFGGGNMLRLRGTVNRGQPYCQTTEEGGRPRSGQACLSTSCSVIVAGSVRAGAPSVACH